MIQNVYAAVPSTSVSNPLSITETEIGGLMGMILNIIIGVGWALTFIMLAMGFIKYILSKGETKATDQARQWLTFAALGGVGLLFITVLKGVILSLIGGSENPVETQFNPFGEGSGS